jgi:hypothetical protein
LRHPGTSAPRHLGNTASYASGLLTCIESMVTSDYLLPRGIGPEENR